MKREDLEHLAQVFETRQVQQNDKIEESIVSKQETVTERADTLPVVKTDNIELIERNDQLPTGDFSNVVGSVSQNILNRAQEKISDDKIVDKHAENLKKVADRALEVEAERVHLTVQEQDADNRVRKQEIKNKLIVLKSEAKRLEKEQKQLNREQKADHKARNKAAKWELYKDKLERMHYTYVPCAFVLSMLLLFDGIRSFFDGLGTVSTAIVKAFKWVLLIGAILIVLFSIPVTRDWLTKLLSGGH